MKTLECVRCHRKIKLDEYVAHLAGCKPTVKPVENVATESVNAN